MQSHSPAINEVDFLFDRLQTLGFVTTAAAGNDGIGLREGAWIASREPGRPNVNVWLPCHSRFPICVGSVGALGQPPAARARIPMSDFSDWGNRVDIFAPGERIPVLGL